MKARGTASTVKGSKVGKRRKSNKRGEERGVGNRRSREEEPGEDGLPTRVIKGSGENCAGRRKMGLSPCEEHRSWNMQMREGGIPSIQLGDRGPRAGWLADGRLLPIAGLESLLPGLVAALHTPAELPLPRGRLQRRRDGPFRSVMDHPSTLARGLLLTASVALHSGARFLGSGGVLGSSFRVYFFSLFFCTSFLLYMYTASAYRRFETPG